MYRLDSPPEVDFGTMTIQNVTDKLLEVMYDHGIYYLKPGEKWSLDREIARLMVTHHRDQLKVVAEDEPPTIPPSINPNKNKTYREMHPHASNEKSRPWCLECGKAFTSSGQLMMHTKKHTAASRKKEAEKAAAEATEVSEPVEEEKSEDL